MIAFTDPRVAHEWATRQFIEYLHDTTADEKRALNYYKSGGYKEINGFLRSKKADENWMNDALEEHQLHIVHLDRFFKQHPMRLDDELIVFRGHRALAQQIRAFENGTLKGQMIFDFALWSTSLIEEEAVVYYEQPPYDYFLLEIHLPRASFGFYIELMDNLRQFEILLPRKTEFFVTNAFTDIHNRRRVIGQVITQ